MNTLAPLRFAALGIAVSLAPAACGRPAGPSTPEALPALRIPAASPAPRRAVFPPTHANVHLNLVFNGGVRDLRKEIGVVDVVWGSVSPRPPQVFNQFYTPFERDGPYGGTHSPAWWKQHHPDWIEYRCDRTTIAYEFGEKANVPLDIANPGVLAYQRSSAVDPAFAAGYRSIDFDNLSLGNFARRCGHYASSGAWVAQYSGAYGDAAYRNDVIAWAQSTYAYVHAYAPSATMAINYSYQSDSTFAQNMALMTQTDEVLDERGFTNWGDRRDGPATGTEWSQIVRAIRALQNGGTCYMENGEEPGASQDISQAQRLWVVGNYLLTRDDCTYVWMSGFSPSGAQQYGRLWIFPEYGLKVGEPTGSAAAAGKGWERSYANGLVLVNPSNARVTFHLEGRYVDENGKRYASSIALPGGTAQILLTARTGGGS